MKQQELAALATDVRGTVGQMMRALRTVQNPEALTPSQSSVLGRLRRDGPTTQAGLAAAEHIRPQSMAAILRPLDDLGYLERTQDATDGRRVLISLSPSGRAAIEGLNQQRDEWLVLTLAALEPAEADALRQAMPVLRRVAASFSK